MAKKKDWLPSNREAILEQGRGWIRIFETKAAAWGMKETVRTTLIAYHKAAKDALEAIVEKETRTSVAIAECREAFKVLKAFMRDIKRRYFHMPPLTPADFVALGLEVPDETKTPIPAPALAPDVLIETTHNHFEHNVRAVNPLNGKSSKPDGVHGVSYAWQLGGEKPASGEKLPHSRFSRKTNMSIGFTEAERGMIVYYAVCYENESGAPGPWSRIEDAIIG